MTFQLSAQLKKIFSTNGITGEPIQTAYHTDPHRCATAQAPRTRHGFVNPAGEGKWTNTNLLEEKAGGGVQNVRQPSCLIDSLHRNPVVQAQRHPQAIEPWSKIRDARWNANRNSAHNENIKFPMPQPREQRNRGMLT